MNLQQFQQALINAANELKAEGPNIVRRSANDMIAVVERRVKEEGVGEYSKKGVPSFYFRGKELNARGKTYLEDDNYFSDKDDLVTWGEFRKFQGLQNDHVDLSYTNRMWTGITVMRTVTITNGVWQAQIGGTDSEVDDKIKWNMERYGDFLQPTEEEQKELLEDSKEEVLDIIRKHIT